MAKVPYIMFEESRTFSYIKIERCYTYNIYCQNLKSKNKTKQKKKQTFIKLKIQQETTKRVQFENGQKYIEMIQSNL